MASRRRYDMTQVALVAVVGTLAIAAMVALGVTWEKLASVPASEWLLIASALTGVVTTAIAAVRRAMVEPVARIPRTDPPEAER